MDGAYNGIDGAVELAREDLAHAAVVLLAAEEAVDEDYGCAEGAGVGWFGGRLPKVVGEVDGFAARRCG